METTPKYKAHQKTSGVSIHWCKYNVVLQKIHILSPYEHNIRTRLMIEWDH